MASSFTIPQIITFQKISQYLAGNDRASQLGLKSGSFIGNLEGLLYMEGYLLENMYTLNPNSPTLRSTAEYVLSLCGKYLQQAIKIVNGLTVGLPILTGPSDQSVNVGNDAMFTVLVAGTGPFTYSWYLNGVIIPGATDSSYTKTNAQLSDTGELYSVAVTNSAGTVTSNTATLTVTAALVGFYYQGNTDYSTDLLSGTDDVAYLGSFSITNGQPFTITFPHLGASEYIVVKYPDTQPTKTTYENPPAGVDTAGIPGLAWEVTAITTWKYIFSRTGNTFGLNNINGQIKFS